MNHTYHFTLRSNNAKTGPIPVTTTSADSCPPTCSFKGNGCYAEHGPLVLHWRAVTAGTRGGTIEELCAAIAALPDGQLWRHNQAGDLPVSRPGKVHFGHLKALVKANRGRRGFTYTHHRPTAWNRAVIHNVNAMGFTINWSAETLEQADQFADMAIGPVVCVLPADATKPMQTPGGRTVVVCPATQNDDIDCARCELCQKVDRKSIVGFPAHGSGAAKVQKVFFMEKV